MIDYRAQPAEQWVQDFDKRMEAEAAKFGQKVLVRGLDANGYLVVGVATPTPMGKWYHESAISKEFIENSEVPAERYLLEVERAKAQIVADRRQDS